MEQQSYFSVTFLGIRIHFFCHHTNKGAIVLFFILLTHRSGYDRRDLFKSFVLRFPSSGSNPYEA
jgi:hypothetical protein